MHVVIYFKDKKQFTQTHEKLKFLKLGYTNIPDTKNILFPYSGLQLKDITRIVRKIFHDKIQYTQKNITKNEKAKEFN